MTPAAVDLAGGPPPAAHHDLHERTLVLWTTLVGCVCLELFGHFNGAFTDPDVWFDRAMAVAAEGVGLTLPAAALRPRPGRRPARGGA